ncbi:MAG: hypothetical protein R3A13_12125 [Bdellovibrionota bacterium]
MLSSLIAANGINWYKTAWQSIFGTELDLKKIRRQDKLALANLNQGKDLQVSGLELSNIARPTLGDKWQAAEEKVAELGIISAYSSAKQVLENIPREEVIARIKLAIDIAKKQKLYGTEELAHYFHLVADDRFRFKQLVTGRISYTLWPALEFADKNQFLSPAEAALFVWPAYRAAFLTEINKRRNTSDSLQDVQKLCLNAARAKDVVGWKKLKNVLALHRKKALDQAVDPRQVIARCLAIYEMAENIESDKKIQITSISQLAEELNISYSFFTSMMSGRYHLSPKRAIKLFREHPYIEPEYIAYFVRPTQRQTLVSYLKRQQKETFDQKTLECIDQRIDQVLSSVKGNAQAFRDFFAGMYMNLEHSKEDPDPIVVRSRKGLLRFVGRKIDAYAVREGLGREWGIPIHGIGQVLSGRASLRLGFVFKLLKSEGNLPAEYLYFFVDKKVQPYYIGIINFMNEIKIDRRIIKALEKDFQLNI